MRCAVGSINALSRKGDKSLKESMWLFRNNPENLNADQTAHLDELKQANLITAKAYQMRLNLQAIYNELSGSKRKSMNGATGCSPLIMLSTTIHVDRFRPVSIDWGRVLSSFFPIGWKKRIEIILIVHRGQSMQ